jgi:galactokinase
VEENNRVLDGCELLQNNDILGFGQKMYASHKGLSELYEVSCRELDILVTWAKNESSIAGARMMGGGFGGCTINLIKEQDIEAIFNKFAPKYLQETGKELKMYIASPQDGARVVS